MRGPTTTYPCSIFVSVLARFTTCVASCPFGFMLQGRVSFGLDLMGCFYLGWIRSVNGTSRWTEVNWVSFLEMAMYAAYFKKGNMLVGVCTTRTISNTNL